MSGAILRFPITFLMRFVAFWDALLQFQKSKDQAGIYRLSEASSHW